MRCVCMEFCLYVAVFVGILIAIKGISFFIKQVVMYIKLKSECKKIGASLIGTHLFWILGSRKSRLNDCYIEMYNKIYSVKLFPSNSRRKILVFTGKGTYYFKKYLGFIANTGARTVFSNDSKHKKIPSYLFRKKFQEEWYLKEFVPVLLVCPCRYDVLCQVSINKLRTIDAGEFVDDMMIIRFSDFIRHIKGVNYEYSQLNYDNQREGN